jgi:hypothetical protein
MARTQDHGLGERVKPETPRLLARKSQHGYVEVDPRHPEDDMHRAMFSEPEPVPHDYQQRITNSSRMLQDALAGDQLVAQHARSIGIQVKEAARRGDTKALSQLGQKLTQLAGTALA